MANVSLFTTSRSERGNGSGTNSVNGHNVHPDDEIAALPYDEQEEVTISADAEQNADMAADYWALL